MELQQPLRRTASKRLKSTDSPPVQATPAAKGRVPKEGRKTRTRTATLPGNGRAMSAALKRTESMRTSNDKNATKKPKLRSVVSAGDLQCSMAGSAAHITVTTGEGRTVCFSEETKGHDINLDLLDDVAWCQIQRLSTLMDHLSSRCQR